MNLRCRVRWTFYDPQPYTYQEALDVLNVILSMKGVALVETGRYLQLSKLENIKKLPLKVIQGVMLLAMCVRGR